MSEPAIREELNVGDRVCLVEGVEGPECRTGTIIECARDKDGYFVLHDEPERIPGFGEQQIFGWAYDEVVAL